MSLVLSYETIHQLDTLTEPWFSVIRPVVSKLFLFKPISVFLISQFGFTTFTQLYQLTILKPGNEQLFKEFADKVLSLNFFSVSSFFFLPQIFNLWKNKSLGGSLALDSLPNYLIELATNLFSMLYYAKSMYSGEPVQQSSDYYSDYSGGTSSAGYGYGSSNNTGDSRWLSLINSVLVFVQASVLIMLWLFYKSKINIFKAGLPLIAMLFYYLGKTISLGSLFKLMLLLKPLNLISNILIMLNNPIRPPDIPNVNIPGLTKLSIKNSKSGNSRKSRYTSISYIGAVIDAIFKLQDSFTWGVVLVVIGLALIINSYLKNFIRKTFPKKTGKKID